MAKYYCILQKQQIFMCECVGMQPNWMCNQSCWLLLTKNKSAIWVVLWRASIFKLFPAIGVYKLLEPFGWILRLSRSVRVIKIYVVEAKLLTVSLTPFKIIQEWPSGIALYITPVVYSYNSEKINIANTCMHTLTNC